MFQAPALRLVDRDSKAHFVRYAAGDALERKSMIPGRGPVRDGDGYSCRRACPVDCDLRRRNAASYFCGPSTTR